MRIDIIFAIVVVTALFLYDLTGSIIQHIFPSILIAGYILMRAIEKYVRR